MPRSLSASVPILDRVFHNREDFDASGTFNVPAAVSFVWVSIWGAGSNDINAGNHATKGSGGSAWYRHRVAVTPSGTETVTIGATGTSGGDSSFGSLVAAGGRQADTGGTESDDTATPIAQVLVAGVHMHGQPGGTHGRPAGAFGARWGGHGRAGYCIVEW